MFLNSLFWQRACFAKCLFWQRACSGKEPALAKSLLWHLKTLCLKHILDTKMTQIIYEQQSRDTDNFFRCMLSLLYSFGLFVCGFLNFLQCFFFFCFCIFFLTCVKSSWLSFPFFLPSFLSVSLFYFVLVIFFSFVLFCFVFGFVSCFLFFRASPPRNFVLLLMCVHFFLFIFKHSFFFSVLALFLNVYFQLVVLLFCFILS